MDQIHGGSEQPPSEKLDSSTDQPVGIDDLEPEVREADDVKGGTDHYQAVTLSIRKSGGGNS